MRGLDPRIHGAARTGITMDRRVEPGDDNENVETQTPISPT
jgi:hypothetical protein